MLILRFILLFGDPSKVDLLSIFIFTKHIFLRLSYRVRYLAIVQSLVRVARAHYLTGKM